MVKAYTKQPNLSATRRQKSFSNYMKSTTGYGKTLVLSDVDGTLLRGSLVLDHAVSLHASGTLSLGPWPERWLSERKNEAFITGLAESYREAIVGFTEQELRLPEFIASVVANPSNLYSSLERLRHHQAAGHQVVLVSGSPSYLVKPFAKLYGFKAIASVYMKDRNGRLTGKLRPMFGAEQKEAAIGKLNLSTYEQIIGYGDTASDIPLLRAADYAVLVDPNKETLKSVENISIAELIRY